MDLTTTTVLLLALSIGVIAGLRTMMALAAVSWAARLGWLDLTPTGLAFLGHAAAPWVLTVLALGELVTDQLPTTPSRKVPLQFAGRLLSGGLSGAAIGAGSSALIAGFAAGTVGAIIGTLGGSAARGWLARLFGQDRPAALIEDAVAIAGALLIITVLR